MSSPMRQMNQRRLPPLPGTTAVGSKTSPKPAKPHLVSGEMHGGAGIVPLMNGHSYGLQSPSYASDWNHRQRSPALSNELNSDLVVQYLNENPDFLESYVLSHVNQERLQRWTAWKEQARRQRHGEPGVNGEIIPDRKTSLSKWKACMQSKKWMLLQELTRDIHNHTNKTQVLAELASCVATATSAEGHNLYLLEEHSQELYYQRPTNNNSSTSNAFCVGRVGPTTTTLAGYVAYTADVVRSGDILADDRFPDGLAVGGDKAQSVMALPVVKGDGKVAGVLELFRNVGGGIFTLEDEEVAVSMLMWADICVEYVEMYNCMTKQRKLNEFLLAVTKSIFQDIVSMDTVIMKIMNYAKKLVNADRASLFLLDTNTNELYARIFDTGQVTNENVPSKEIRFPMDKGVAGHVASTGHVLNIPDAYMDRRFNREVDMQTGYKTQTILCMPIYIRGSIIGVVQMVNKLQGTFTKADEESFETFAIYCGLALHHAKLYEKIRRSEQKYRVALEVLSYHSTCPDEEFLELKELAIPDHIPGITDYTFSPWDVSGEDKPVYVLYMFRDLFLQTSLNHQAQKRYDMDDLRRFTLTVRKNYRNVPYHNWDHAFSVAHAVFTVIKTAKHQFTPQECLALFVACLCHDLDHRGKTNAFMVKSASPLAAVYSTSTMEHHHFNQTVTIMQNEGHNIFKHLSSEDYKKMLSDIRHSILATDLALFFGNRAKLKELCDNDDFDWDFDDHRALVMANCMTACDLCSMYKPWDTQLQLVYVIMEEFWQQGDEEKMLGNNNVPKIMDRTCAYELPDLQGDEEKQKGLTPMPMMDREKKHELPQLEVGFLVGICIPCYQTMAQVLPETKPMVDGSTANLKKWKELADLSREEVERILGENMPKPRRYSRAWKRNLSRDLSMDLSRSLTMGSSNSENDRNDNKGGDEVFTKDTANTDSENKELVQTRDSEGSVSTEDSHVDLKDKEEIERNENSERTKESESDEQMEEDLEQEHVFNTYSYGNQS